MNKRKWQIFVILIIFSGIIFNMVKIKDLSSKFDIPNAEKELELLMGQIPMGSQLGGLSLFSNKFKRGYGDAVFGSDENGIWLGGAEFAGAPFRVNMAGDVVANSIILGSNYSKVKIFRQDGVPTSVSIGDLWFDTDDNNKTYRAASIGANEITAGEWEESTLTGYGQNFVSALVWTATDADTATWAAGSIKTSDGTVYSIASGNTGNIAALTYVYLDPATSITVLQKTTTAASAVGGEKILVAIVQKGATGAKCIIDVVGSSGTTIDGDKIITGKIQSKDGNTFFDLDGDLIQIQDENSTTIIDAKGLVSTANFTFDTVFHSTLRTTTSTSFIDIANTSLSFSLSRSTRVLILIGGKFGYTSFTSEGVSSVTLALDIDGTLYPDSTVGFGQVHYLSDAGTGGYTAFVGYTGLHYIKNLASGNHTIKLRWRKSDSSGEISAKNTTVSYLVLGK